LKDNHTTITRTLVVTVGSENDSTISFLKFDGLDMNLAAISNSGQTQAAVYYLDIANGGGIATGDITFEFAGTGNGIVIGAYSLYNVESGGPAATSTGGNDSGNDITLSYTGASIGDYVVESAAGQGMNGTSHKPIENITLENVSIKAMRGMSFKWVNGLKLTNVKSEPSKGRPISFTDCKDVQ
jgi:hypothetical protein